MKGKSNDYSSAACNHGHPFPENVRVDPGSGRRYCKECHESCHRAWRARNREKWNEIQRAFYHRSRVFRRRKLRYEQGRREIKYSRRKVATGRVCRDCGRTDAEVYWSDNRERCGACAALTTRNGVCECGSPRRVKSGSRAPRGACSCPLHEEIVLAARALEIPAGIDPIGAATAIRGSREDAVARTWRISVATIEETLGLSARQAQRRWRAVRATLEALGLEMHRETEIARSGKKLQDNSVGEAYFEFDEGVFDLLDVAARLPQGVRKGKKVRLA